MTEHSNLRIQNQSHGSGALTTATVSFYVVVLCTFGPIINRYITVVLCITQFCFRPSRLKD